ncbi:MAG: acetyltransferase [Acidimicrobiia bacterium]
MTRDWVLFGVRTPFTGEVIETLQRSGAGIGQLVDNLADGPQPIPWGASITPDQLDLAGHDAPCIVPITTPGFRAIAVTAARAAGCSHFPALVDPTAVVASSATVGEGSYINALVVVGASAVLEPFVQLNRNASIAHDVHLGAYCTVGPGAVIGGSVTIGAGAFIGIGATILPEVHIGANAIVGGGAVVTRDVPEFATVVGNPARVVRTGTAGYQGATLPASPTAPTHS